MKRLSTFEKLQLMGEGSYHCGRSFLFSKGWISITIEEKEPSYLYQLGHPFSRIEKIWELQAFWTENKHSTSHGTGCAMIFDLKGNISNVFTHAISMWIVNDRDKKRNIIKYLNRKINLAYIEFTKK